MTEPLYSELCELARIADRRKTGLKSQDQADIFQTVRNQFVMFEGELRNLAQQGFREGRLRSPRKTSDSEAYNVWLNHADYWLRVSKFSRWTFQSVGLDTERTTLVVYW